MTLPAATGLSARPLSAFDHRPRRAGPAPAAIPSVAMRLFEVAALRPDGTVTIGQHKAPAIAYFEQAFSAFARGTLIATPRGDVAIEDLQPGETVSTGGGRTARITWIGSSNFVPADAGRRMPLTRIMADSFGQGRPSCFLTTGPAARILHTPQHLRGEVGEARLLTALADFVDGETVIEVTPPTPVRLFHLCLEHHATLIAGGLEMESFHPGAQSRHDTPSALRDRFLGLFPQLRSMAEFGALAYPRAPLTEPV